VFENALKSSANNLHQIDRYTYFNFEHIHSASNSDYSSGIMAAVIAETNLKALSLNKNARMIFFCDEVPFFIKKNGSFFKLTTANFRKYGHSTILIAQSTKDFELKHESNESDCGIIQNSPIRFLFQIDGKEKEFADKLGLFESDLVKIRSLVKAPTFRDVLLQDDLGTRVLRIFLTTKEYWLTTTSKKDRDKLNKLRTQIPDLSLKEAINCLTHGVL